LTAIAISLIAERDSGRARAGQTDVLNSAS
jgi:hypothetical protein